MFWRDDLVYEAVKLEFENMRHIQQPIGSNLCGQTCIAMILDTTIEAVCHEMGKRGKTRTKDLVRRCAATDTTCPTD